MSADEDLRWLWLACLAALQIWDDNRWELLSTRFVQLARGAGSLSELPLALNVRAYMLLFAGELGAAAALADEVQAVAEVTGASRTFYTYLGLAALRGDQSAALAMIEGTTRDAAGRGEGIVITIVGWADAGPEQWPRPLPAGSDRVPTGHQLRR